MLHVYKTSDRKTEELKVLMAKTGLAPVVADIGSAGATPAVWRPIAAASTIIGFEPDDRNPDPNFGAEYANALLVNSAIVPDDNRKTVEFVLTQYPSCSSMLEADLDALGSFVFRDYFKPVGKVTARATSLNRVIKENNLPGLHWLKLNSQGADLRILKSLSQANLDTVLAVDIEPGLIDAYKGEDLFPECHTWLKDQGFWLAEIFHQAYAKIRPETVEWLEGQGYDNKKLLAALPKSPTCVEGRYLRELRWLEANNCNNSIWLMAMVFGLCAQQIGHVFDLAKAYEGVHGRDDGLAGVVAIAKELIREMGV